jgi:hypothetical protein
MAKVDVNAVVHGKPSGQHESMSDVLQGWDQRINESWIANAEVRQGGKRPRRPKLTWKDGTLPSDVDPNFRYGMSTRDMDVKSDPLHRSNAIIEQRIAQREKEMRKEDAQMERDARAAKQLNPRRSTAASRGHVKHPPREPGLKDTFKMKRFVKFQHGMIDTGLRRPAAAAE